MQRSICDPTLQDCPNDDEKCTAYAQFPEGPWHSWVCRVMSPDPKDVGETCRVAGRPNAGCDDCVAGAICLFVYEEDGEGVCVPFCDPWGGDPGCAENQFCAIASDGVLLLCLDRCNPLSPTCPHGPGCLYLDNNQDFACGPPGASGGYGDACTNDLGSCAEGLACVDREAFPEGECPSGCCTQACDLSAPNQCPHAQDGQVCTPLYEPGQAPPGNENVGLCRMP
jgi:hypothetical protein